MRTLHERVKVKVVKTASVSMVIVKEKISLDVNNRFEIGEKVSSYKFDAYYPGDLLEVTFNCAAKHRDPFSITKVGVSIEELPVSKRGRKPGSKNTPKEVNFDEILPEDNDGVFGLFKNDNNAVRQGLVNVIAQKVKKETKVEPLFHIEPEHKEVFSLANAMLLAEPQHPRKIMIVGPSGCGKTTTAEHFAKKTGRKYFRMNCGSVLDVHEWFGQKIATDGSTSFVKSEFIKVVEEGNAVVVLDETNRLPSFIGNSVLPLLDDSASTTIEDQTFKVGPNVLFVGTMNLGFQYAGTFEIDAALSNRFDMFCSVGFLPMTKEIEVIQTRYTNVNYDAAALIVKVATKIRDAKLPIEFSTRTTLQISALVNAGASVRTAVQHCFIIRCPVEDGNNVRKTAIDLINPIAGIYSPSEVLFNF